MNSTNGSTSVCGHCRFYHLTGRRGGECHQLEVPVKASWKACSLAQSPFETANPRRHVVSRHVVSRHAVSHHAITGIFGQTVVSEAVVGETVVGETLVGETLVGEAVASEVVCSAIVPPKKTPQLTPHNTIPIPVSAHAARATKGTG